MKPKPKVTYNKKTAEDAPKAVYGKKDEPVSVAPVVEVKTLEIARCRCFRYSAECIEGRIFEAGDTIPAGWFDSPAKIAG